MITDNESGLLASMLQRFQQGLLRMGYTYVYGDERAWPLTNVVMEKDGRMLLLVLWLRDNADTLIRYYRSVAAEHRDTGMLVVGADPNNADELYALFDSLPGLPLAYVDITNLRYRLQLGEDKRSTPPDALSDDALHWLLNPGHWAANADIDCLAIMHLQLAAREAGDAEESERRLPPFTTALIAACVVMFLVSLLKSGLGGLLAMPARPLLDLGSLWAPLVYYHQWWRILTSAFLHGGIIHLGMNMAALYFIGAPLEKWEGPWRLAALYFFSVITASLLSLFLLPTASSVGASGGIFGLLGVILALLLRHRRVLPRDFRAGLYRWLGTVLPLNILISFAPSINWAAHLGGLVGGFLMGLILTRPPFRSARVQAWEWAALLALLLAAVAFGAWTIGRIPLAFPPGG